MARSDVLPPFRKELRHLLECAGWQKKTAEEILLAVDEALTNVIRHAFEGRPGKMVVFLEDEPAKTEIVIEDQGKKFDPTQMPSPELPRQKPGGLGIHFIRTIMDRMVYDNDYQEGNRLHLIKFKPKNFKREGAL